MEDEELLFALMDELERMKIRYHVLGTDWRRGTGRGENVYVDRQTRRIMPGVEAVGNLVLTEKEEKEADPDPDAFIDPVSSTTGSRGVDREEKAVVGENVTIGENVHFDDDRMDIDETVPEHDDLAPTPGSLSPIRSPRLEPSAHNDTPLIDLPPFATLFNHIHNQHDNDTTAPSPPDSPPPESLFPDTPFPGAFPPDPVQQHPFSTSTSSTATFTTTTANIQTLQTRISIALQAALDSLARVGHMTITVAQNTGFPVQNPPHSFDSARHRLDTNTTSARNALNSSLDQARDTLESSLDTARTNISLARTNLESSLDVARTSLESSLATARRGLDFGVVGARDGLNNATRQVEQAIRNAAQTVQEVNVITPATADSLIGELRLAGERVERAVEEMTLRLQRRIDAHPPPMPEQEPLQREEEDLYGVPPVAGADGASEGYGGQERFGTGSLPGAFPVETSEVEECADRLVEMGFFGEGERDSAMAVSVAANGDIQSALDIVSGE